MNLPNPMVAVMSKIAAEQIRKVDPKVRVEILNRLLLIFCPFCGSDEKQGAEKCPKCGAVMRKGI